MTDLELPAPPTNVRLPGSLEFQLNALHQLVKMELPQVDRIGIALYDNSTDLLHTYLYSADQMTPLSRYSAKLSDSDSLSQLSQQRAPRIIDDLQSFTADAKAHTSAITAAGYRSSFTLPLYFDQQFAGFLFFNSTTPAAFREGNGSALTRAAQLIELMLQGYRQQLQTLQQWSHSVRTQLSQPVEHPDTLQRIRSYARLLAKTLAKDAHLDDATIESIAQYAPLCSLAKIELHANADLDNLGTLGENLRKRLQMHPVLGYSLLEKIMHDAELSALTDIGILKNILLCYQEHVDGSGTPYQLSGDEIPLEARIVAVVDRFDQLTQTDGASMDSALQQMQQEAGSRFDPACVQALGQDLVALRQIMTAYPQH